MKKSKVRHYAPNGDWFTKPVVKNSAGRYYVEYYYNGSRKRKYFDAVPQKQAANYGRELARKIWLDLQGGEVVERGKQLREIMPEVIASLQVRKTSRYSYERTWKLWEHSIGKLYTNEISAGAVVQLLHKQQAQKNYSANTFNTYCNVIKILLNHAAKQGYCAAIKIDALKNKQQPTKHVLLTAQEIKTLKKACLSKRPELWKVAQLMYYVGLRPKEITRIKAEHIQNGVLHLPADLTKNNVKLVRRLPFKFEPINSTTDSLNYAFQQIKHWVRLEHVTLYSFRHTAAVRLYENTKDIKRVQHFLRHSNLSTTDKYLRNLGLMQEQEISGLPQL